MKRLSLSHKVMPNLLVTPQLKQALSLLKLPLPRFKDFLERQIEENPLLQSPDFDLMQSIKRALGFDSTYSAATRPGESLEEIPPSDSQETRTPTLHEYLLHQVRMLPLSGENTAIAEDIVYRLNAQGYLLIPLEKISLELNQPITKIQESLEIIQTLEPAGIGARNLQECLLIQLKQNEKQTSLAYTTVKKYFKELSKKNYGLIAKKLSIPTENVIQAVKEITSLSPRPGLQFSHDETPQKIIPDISVKVEKGKIIIAGQEEKLPILCINSKYKKLLNNPSAPDEIKQFIKERLRNAMWLIRAVEQRKTNSLKVFKTILRLQQQAILKHTMYLKPLTLGDIAKLTGLHVSTVGRIVSNKYIQTPQGTIKAKDLFSPRLSLTRGGSISRKTVLTRIEESILRDDPTKPLTDQEICEQLRAQGISISRRTVTKYRNSLKIYPSFLRQA